MRGSPFFEGVPQMDARLGDEVVKLPIFYYDGIATGAFFPAKLGALRRLLPDRRMSPARLAPGLGVVGIMCFEYRDTDIGPYNELAISIPLNEPWFLSNLPGRAMLAGLARRQLHGWVHHLPVTTEIARVAGVDLYNYPKFIGGIEFTQTDRQRVCRLTEGQEHILTLTVERIATPRSEQVQLFSHLWMDRQPQGSEFKINAIEIGSGVRPSAARLELGDHHPIARELAGLLVSRRPILYQYVPRFEGILYGPEHLTLPMIDRLAAQSGARDQVSAA
jgi:Acetoacetate decarboxylase (ADC)